MNVQIITNDPEKSSWTKFVINKFNEPKAFDMFDINIIDLAYDGIWVTSGRYTYQISCIDDLVSLKKIIESSKKPVVIVFPQNEYIKPIDNYLQDAFIYNDSLQIKNNIKTVCHDIINKLVGFTGIAELIYENSVTDICGKCFESEFVFSKTNVDYGVNTKTIGGEKATTISRINLYITTLKILDNPDSMIDYLKGIDLFNEEQEPYPEWLESYHILDDEKQTELIEGNKQKIKDLQCEIDSANEKLEENKNIKSILYTNGDQLVEQVFRILEIVLDCNLSEFIDKKNEDFLIPFHDITFIGEIKGVTSNIKSEHISQLDVHYQGYMDKLQESGTKENVKEILIMNPFRNKPLEERTEVHENQIKLAERNNCLMIETITLLNIYEKVVDQEIKPSEVKEIFKNEKGLLSLNSFE